MGRSDDGAQYVFSFLFTYGRSFDGVMTSSVNEKLDEDNFFNGVSCPDSQVTSFLIISIDQGHGNLPLQAGRRSQ